MQNFPPSLNFQLVLHGKNILPDVKSWMEKTTQLPFQIDFILAWKLLLFYGTKTDFWRENCYVPDLRFFWRENCYFLTHWNWFWRENCYFMCWFRFWKFGKKNSIFYSVILFYFLIFFQFFLPVFFD